MLMCGCEMKGIFNTDDCFLSIVLVVKKDKWTNNQGVVHLLKQTIARQTSTSC